MATAQYTPEQPYTEQLVERYPTRVVPATKPVGARMGIIGGIVVAIAAAAVATVVVTSAGDTSTSISPQEAQTARLEGLAIHTQAQELGITQAMLAESLRWQGIAAEFATATGLTRGQQAEAARYTGLAEFHLNQGLSPAQQAVADRYTGLAEHHANPPLTRSQQVVADRWNGLAGLDG